MAKKFNVGVRVRIKDNLSRSSSYYHYAGMTGVIVAINYSSLYSSLDIELDDGGDKLYEVGYSIIELNNNSNSKERFILAVERKKAEIAEIEEKLRFLEETGQTNFDENEFKAYRTLTLIEEQDLTKAERAKKIAELLK
jgi:hypothetical protein